MESYIAVPLYRRNGALFGTLCALDPRPANMSDRDLEMISLLAHLISYELHAEEEFLTLQRMNRLRERLIGILGHDLRNPLTAIKLSADTLKENPHLEEDQRQALSLIETSAVRMTHMVTDLMDFTRSRLEGTHSISRQPGLLMEVCCRILREYKVTHPGREISLSSDSPDEEGQGEWDADRMAQAFSNLIGNALKFSPPDTPIRIEFAGGEDWVHVSVHNGGSTIPDELLGQVFEPFVQGPQPGNASGVSEGLGLGLGLYIVERVVHAHNGSVSVHSSPRDGTTFTLLLPRMT